jgi:hypothetical protein
MPWDQERPGSADCHLMGVMAAAFAGLATVSCAAALAAPGATVCSFAGARWEADDATGNRYAVTSLRGVTCAQAITLARPLTRKQSLGLRARVPAPAGWLCLSFAPGGSSVSRGACARLGKRLAWEPTGGKPLHGKPPADGGKKPPIKTGNQPAHSPA